MAYSLEFKRSPAPHSAVYAEGDIRYYGDGQTLVSEGDLREFFKRHPDCEWVNLALDGGGFVKLTRATFSV